MLLCGERDAEINLLMASLATSRTELLTGQGIFVAFSGGTNCLLLGPLPSLRLPDKFFSLLSTGLSPGSQSQHEVAKRRCSFTSPHLIYPEDMEGEIRRLREKAASVCLVSEHRALAAV